MTKEWAPRAEVAVFLFVATVPKKGYRLAPRATTFSSLLLLALTIATITHCYYSIYADMSSSRFPPRATTMYASSTHDSIPVPLPRPKSEVAIAPRRPLPPPPPVPSSPLALLAAHPPPPKRPVPQAPSQPSPEQEELPLEPPLLRTTSSPKRSLPTPPSPSLPLQRYNDQPSDGPGRTPSLAHGAAQNGLPLSPEMPASDESRERPHPWRQVLPDAENSCNPGHTNIDVSKRCSLRPPSTPPTSPKPAIDPSSAPPPLPRRPTVSIKRNEVHTSEISSAPAPAAHPAPPLPSRSESIMKRIQDMQLNHTSPVPPSKPPRVDFTKVSAKESDASDASSPTPPTLPARPALPKRPAVSARIDVHERPPVPGRPAVPERPTVPERRFVPEPSVTPERPSVSDRPTIPERPPLPARRPTLPTLPKRPQPSAGSTRTSISTTSSTSSSTTSSTSHSTSNNFTSTTTSVSSIFSSTASRLLSSTASSRDRSSPAPLPSVLPPRSLRSPPHAFQAGDDPMAILALSKPVTTENFDGERIDYSRFDFTVQDQHADACPVSETQSIVRLSNYLTAPFAGDRLAQLRAIFTWIAKNIRYNKTGLLADNRGDNSAEAVLRNRLGVCAGYSNLFMALSAHQGLGVIQVTGDARGDGFKVGTRDMGRGHAWNAVEVDGEWLMIDSTWGTGGWTNEYGSKDVNDNFTPYYFLVRPEQLIYTHFPEKADEQFLDPPVCADLYVDLPVLRPSAWSTGLRPIPGYMGQVLQADDDFVELDVRMIPQVVSSEMAIPRLNLVWNDSPPSTATMISPFWYNEDEETGDVVYSFRFYCPSHGSGVLHACAPVGAGTTKAGVSLTYKVINNGTGAHYLPPILPCYLSAVPAVMVEPWTAVVVGGVQQKVTLRVVQTTRSQPRNLRTKSPMLVVFQNTGAPMRHRPPTMKEIEPGWFEITQVFSPGEYIIGCSDGPAHAPTSYSGIMTFTVK